MEKRGFANSWRGMRFFNMRPFDDLATSYPTSLCVCILTLVVEVLNASRSTNLGGRPMLLWLKLAIVVACRLTASNQRSDFFLRLALHHV